ncbi:E3L [Bat mastadenovirus WIV11]|uniref:E3L n=1 Tax=Bat mastadenovirus WIV11 TaxID=1788433 RepID=A0A163HLA5_9ADEN|nr:E3L [Bat mastadenovirus WIV11]AMB43132.1 E3L [Bat mastadenovirus WIV11]
MRIKEYLSKMKLEACFSFVGLFTLGLICGYLQLPIPTTNPLKKVVLKINDEIWAAQGASVILAPVKPIYNRSGGYYEWLKNGDSKGYSFGGGRCYMPRCTVFDDGSLFLKNLQKEDGGRFVCQYLVDDKFQTNVEYLLKVMSTEELMSKLGGGTNWGPMSPEEEVAANGPKPPSGPRQRREMKKEATSDYQVLAITFFFGAILFFFLVIILCCYKWRVGRLHQLYGSTALLIGGAKAQTPTPEVKDLEEWLIDCFSWWEWLSIALVAVAAVCTIIVLAYVLWKYPPRCCRRGGKSLWLTTPLLLLCVASPAFTAKTYQIPDYYEVEEGGQVMFDLESGSRFQEMNWTKLIGRQEYAVAYVNQTYVKLDFNDRNYTGISMAGIYINASLKLMNISKRAEGTYLANLYTNGKFSYQIFMLGVVYHLKMPVITVEKLNASKCKLLCSCRGENVTLETIVGNTTTRLKYSWQILNSEDVRFLRCTANRNGNKRITLVSVHEPCRPEHIINKVVYANDELLWMLLSLVLMILAAGIWYCVDGIRVHLRARDVMAVPLLTVMLLTPAQAAFSNTNFNLIAGENATLYLNETNVTWILETASPVISYRQLQNFSNITDVCAEVKIQNQTVQLLGIKPTLRTLTAKASNFTHYFYFNISDLQKSSNQQSNYWRDYWWVYLVACVILFLLVLICVICTHKIRLRNRNAWMLGPLVVLMIAVPSEAYFAEYRSLNVSVGDDLNISLKTNQSFSNLTWYLLQRHKPALILAHCNETVALVNKTVAQIICTNISAEPKTLYLNGLKSTPTGLMASAVNYTESFYFIFNSHAVHTTWWFWVIIASLIIIFCLFCWLCAVQIRMYRQVRWFAGPLLILMISDCGSTFKVPEINNRNSICSFVGYSWSRYEAVALPLSNTFKLQLQCNLPLVSVKWHVLNGLSQDKFLEVNDNGYELKPSIINQICSTYDFDKSSFTCKSKSNIKLISASGIGEDGKSSIESFFFNYGNVASNQTIFTKEGDNLTLNCFVEDSWHLHNQNLVIWKVNNNLIGYRAKNGAALIEHLKGQLYTIDRTDFSLTITNIKPFSFGLYECKTQTKPETGHSQIKQYYYNLQPKIPFPTASAFEPNIGFDYNDSETKNLPWWGTTLIGIALIAMILIIGSLVINKMTNQTKKVVLLSPLLLTICIPASKADHLVPKINYNQTFKVLEDDSLLLLGSSVQAQEYKWRKMLPSKTREKTLLFAEIDQNKISRHSSTFTQLGLTKVDVFNNGSIKIWDLKVEASGTYFQEIILDDGQGSRINYKVEVQPRPKPTVAFFTIVTEHTTITNSYRHYWWVTLLAVLTLVLFIGIGIKFYVDNNLGLPPPYYPSSQKKPVYTNQLLLTACLCMLLPTTLASSDPACTIFDKQLYAIPGTPLLINASVNNSIMFRYTWKRQTGGLIMNIVENKTNVHYFDATHYRLEQNASLVVLQPSLALAGTYTLQCVTKQGSHIVDSSVTVIVQEKCNPPNVDVSVTPHFNMKTLNSSCTVHLSCTSNNSAPVTFSSNYSRAVTTNINKTVNLLNLDPFSATCTCHNHFGSAHTIVNVGELCEEAALANHLLLHPLTYVSMHHLWWIYALMLFLAGLAAAAWWWWHKHHKRPDKPNGLKDSAEEKPALKDLAEIV